MQSMTGGFLKPLCLAKARLLPLKRGVFYNFLAAIVLNTFARSII